MNERRITHIPAKPRNVPAVDHPFHVAAYCRVSSPSEEQELSLETQVTYYSNKISNNPLWLNAGVFADTATGRNMKERTAFKKLLVKMSHWQGGFDTVQVHQPLWAQFTGYN